MAYACPVCEALVPDGEHLAHHLAVVAMTRGGDHRAWLDDEVPEWADCSPAELGDAVVDRADEVEHDLVDDPRATGEGRTDAPPGRPDLGSTGTRAGPAGDVHGRAVEAAADARAHAPFERGGDAGDVDDETAAILEEARGLTRQRREDADPGGRTDETRTGEEATSGNEARTDEEASGQEDSRTDSDE